MLQGDVEKRVKVLAFIGYYLPGYKSGGPLRTLLNMVDRLSDDIEFSIVTRDRDLGDVERYVDVKSDTWNTLNSTPIFYMAPFFLGFGMLSRVIREASGSILYINSFFDPVCSIRVLIAYKFFTHEEKRIVLAPRGEFSTGALRIKKAKKRAYIFISRLLGLHNKVIFQASSVYEKNDIIRALNLPPERVMVAVDLAASMPEFSPAAPQALTQDRRLRVIFLSRICAMKNLDYALRVLMRVKRSVIFHIYGPLEDSQYWGECQVLMEQLPPNVSCEYLGEVEPADVSGVFMSYDLFFFPSRGENYGHVIAESLSVGTPVLLSKNTPWRGMSEQGIGWDYDLSEEDLFLKALENYEVLNGADDAVRRISVRAQALSKLLPERALEDNRALFI